MIPKRGRDLFALGMVIYHDRKVSNSRFVVNEKMWDDIHDDDDVGKYGSSD